MGLSRGLTLARRQQIFDRQDPPGWGAAYVPAIQAVREEAPSISRAIRIWSHMLGRYCHLLSTVEAKAALVALYHPQLFELHEQRMLCIEPRPHPLMLHPDYPGQKLSNFEGSLSVADRLGVLKVHPKIRFENDGRSEVAPFPLIGDLLLFLVDAEGPYCVNWTVKQDAEDFDAPVRRERLPLDPASASSDEKARHAIEVCYYRDAGIRTQRVVERDINKDLFSTLSGLLQWEARPSDISAPERAEILDRFRACLDTGRPPLEEMLALCRRHPFSLIDLKALFFGAIWSRELRVDLWEPIFVDQPLTPERRDVLDHFAAWFARGDQHE